MHRTTLVALLGLTACIACEEAPTLVFTNPEWSIQGAVSPVSEEVEVVLSSTGSVPTLTRFVVENTATGDTTELTATSWSACSDENHPDAASAVCYRGLLSDAPSAGDTVVMSGLSSDGRSFSGATSIPTLPTWTVAGSGNRVEIDPDSYVPGRGTPLGSIPLVRPDDEGYWTRLSLAIDTIFVAGAPVPGSCDAAVSPRLPVSTRDTTTTLAVLTLACPANWDSIAATVRIVRFDANVGAFLEAANAEATDETGFGVDGAWGYWGSYTVTGAPVLLIRR